MKFKDCDLIGVPFRVTIGERASKKAMSRSRCSTEKEPVKVRKEEVVGKVMEYVETARSR